MKAKINKTMESKANLELAPTNLEITSQIEVMKNSIPKLIDEQKEILKKLQGEDEDAMVSLDIEYNGVSIKLVDKVSVLNEMESSVLAREAAYTANLKRRGLEGKVVEWTQSGKDISHWKKVFDKAFNALVNKAEIALVKQRVSELEKHLSEEAKLKATLEKLIQEGNTKLA